MGRPLLLVGNKVNLLERKGTLLSASQPAGALFPLSRLHDGRPSQLFIFPALLEDEYFHADVNQYLNGGFESFTAGLPNDHSVILTGTGAVSQEIVAPIAEGAASLEMTNGAAGNVEVVQEIESLAGEQWELRLHTQTSAAGSPNAVEIFNPYTGCYLTPAGAWSRRRQNALELALTVMPDDPTVLAFTVEPFSAVRNHVVDLRIRLHMDAAAANVTHHFDAIRMIPAVDFTSIHAHNLDSAITPRLVSSDEAIASAPVDWATRFARPSATVAAYDRNSIFDGLADGRTGVLSAWVKREADSTLQYLLASSKLSFFFQPGNNMSIAAFSPTSTLLINRNTTGTITADSQWHHILVAWDLDANTIQAFFDDVDAIPGAGVTAGDIDYTDAPFSIGRKKIEANRSFEGQISDVWLGLNQFIDITVARNRQLFRKSNGRPAELGVNGESPTGVSPTIYWRGEATTVNRGTGGDFDAAVGPPVEVVTTEAELGTADVSFYARLAAIKHRRFWKLHLRGINAVNPIEAGLWALGPAFEPGFSPRQGDFGTAQIFPQSDIRVASSGESWRVKKAKHPRRRVSVHFDIKKAHQAQFKDELLKRCSQGADPFIIVADQDKPDVIHGRIPPDVAIQLVSFPKESTDLVIDESSNGISIA